MKSIGLENKVNFVPEYNYEERLVKANKILEESGWSNMFTTPASLIIWLLLKGGGILQIDTLIAKTLEEFMKNSTMDDVAFDAVTEFAKASIPGEEFEPLIGEIFIQVGTRLKAE